MKAVRVLACCLLVFPLVGTVTKPRPKVRTQSPANDEAASRRAGVDALSREVLPPRARMEAEAQDAARAIRGNLEGASGPAQLWRTLFGSMARHFHARTRWLIALDRGPTMTPSPSRFTAGGLPFETPFAALPDCIRQPSVYLAERQVIEVIPGAGYWVEARERPSYGLIALSLTPLRELTRAWLMVGAQAVIGSNWATSDESGALFSALYGILSGPGSASPAAALRAAQMAMIRSGGWKAKPSYWGAYFVVGGQ